MPLHADQARHACRLARLASGCILGGLVELDPARGQLEAVRAHANHEDLRATGAHPHERTAHARLARIVRKVQAQIRDQRPAARFLQEPGRRLVASPASGGIRAVGDHEHAEQPEIDLAGEAPPRLVPRRLPTLRRPEPRQPDVVPLHEREEGRVFDAALAEYVDGPLRVGRAGHLPDVVRPTEVLEKMPLVRGAGVELAEIAGDAGGELGVLASVRRGVPSWVQAHLAKLPVRVVEVRVFENPSHGRSSCDQGRLPSYLPELLCFDCQ